ncbi:uncharacterized protein LOC143256951 isoform X2 [Tachypleus tridentatus]|uniref:uncharacterized protein LOC143256951 isoform X2 n=1 Tax=Tachypleus tridentatus TaxID=6853 RepID=UPI003FD0D90C
MTWGLYRERLLQKKPAVQQHILAAISLFHLPFARSDRAKATLEMSLPITNDTVHNQIELREDKRTTLQANLPHQAILAEKIKKYSMEEKAEEEKSEKEEKTKFCANKTSCDISEGDLEKQEFSFTLYNLDGHKNVTKDDIAGLVRSIHDTLGKSFKLPPSGNQTIKVKLAISPDSEITEEKDNTFHQPKTTMTKEPDSIKITGNVSKQCSNNSVNTCTTYLSSSSGERENLRAKCDDVSLGVNSFPSQLSETKPNMCFQANPRSQQGFRSSSLQRQDMMKMIQESVEKICLDCSEKSKKQYCQNKKNSGEDPRQKRRHRHHHGCRNHMLECCDRCNHYLDLAAIGKLRNDNCYPFSHRLYDKNLGPRTQTNQEVTENHCNKKFNHCSHQRSKSHDANTATRLFHSHVFSDHKDNLMNLNFDLCDLLPEEKFDWERKLHHRRSKSFDVYDHLHSNILYSPKIKLRAKGGLTTAETSPNHHHRHRHRERERLRIMQQMNNCSEKTNLGVSKENTNSNSHSPKVVIQRHEHHHIHEHVHHHYHHYLPS